MMGTFESPLVLFASSLVQYEVDPLCCPRCGVLAVLSSGAPSAEATHGGPGNE